MNTASIQQFEARLEQLEVAARRGDSLSQLLQLAQAAMGILADKNNVVLVVAESDRVRLLAGTMDDNVCRLLAGSLKCGDEVNELVINITSDLIQTSEDSEGWTVSVCRVLSQDHRFVSHFLVGQDPRQTTVLLDAANTIGDILAEASSRRLLSDLNQRLKQHDQITGLMHALGRVRSIDEWSRQVSQRAVEYLGKGRVSVFQRLARDWQLLAVTGSTSFQQGADAVRRNARVISVAAQTCGNGQWVQTDFPSGETEQELRSLLGQYAALGVQLVRVEPISGNDGRIDYALVIEVFDTTQRPPESLVELVRDEIADSLRLLPGSAAQSGHGFFRHPRRRAIAFALVLFILSFLVPANFEIEVPGQAMPKDRRRLFAPDDGIVEELLVSAEDSVTVSQPLLRLRNPERDLDLNRVLGEIESSMARIQAIRATRTSAGPASPGSSVTRSAELSSEEQQIEQRLNSLRLEQALIEQQIASLTLRSPIAGLVYQRRLREELNARPVRRGQLLMEVVNVSGDWELELNIPDSVAGYVQASEATGHGHPEVQFTLGRDNGNIQTTALQSLNLATYLDDGQLVCLATCLVERTATASLRPGQAVTARIFCGRRSLAFIWFREVVEFWKRKKFAWL